MSNKLFQLFRRQRRTKRTTNPAVRERRRIIERRDRLLKELIEILVSSPDNSRKIKRLFNRYSFEEVQMALLIFKRRKDHSFIGEETRFYRMYRLAFAKFGNNRRFLSKEEYETLNYEYIKLFADRKFKTSRRRPSKREEELCDLVLAEAIKWPDLFPQHVPPRPPDYEAPSPGNYDYPARTLLDWGWKIDERRVINNAKNVNKWRRATPDLARMALDEGLINGWPGEKANWAPIHALLMLGALRADEVAPQLFALMDMENDWLSDQLPGVWGKMGSPVEAFLWDYIDNRQHDPDNRGMAMLGLVEIAQEHPLRRFGIVQGLINRLQDAPVDDAEANAYIVHVLDQFLDAPEATDIIEAAFEAGKIDERIIAPYDVDSL